MSDVYQFVFVMDPYVTLNLETETSLLLMEDLISRGHKVFWLDPKNLYLSHQQVRGGVQQVMSVTPFSRLAQEDYSLNDCDALLVRIDPPVDSHYLHMTYLLDQLDGSVVQFNDVAALRNFNEKLLPLHWPDLTPPSIVSSSPKVIEAFLKEHGDIVIKPLDDCSGRGIRRFRKALGDSSEDAESLRLMLVDSTQKPRYLMAQKFLSDVSKGDKRVYLVDGDVVGLVNRVPQKGRYLANIHQGAHCETTVLTEQEEEALMVIAPFLKENGLFFVGVDFIGGYITEINLTSPSAIRQINEVMGVPVHKLLVDRMLDKMWGKPAIEKVIAETFCCGVRWVA